MQLKNKELLEISGGAVTNAMINTLVRCAATVLDITRAIGSAIHMAIYGRRC